MKYYKFIFLLVLLAISLLVTACGGGGGDDKSNTTRSIQGWGTPPDFIKPASNEEAKERIEKSVAIMNGFMDNLKNYRETLSAQEAIQNAVDDLKNNSDVAAVKYDPSSIYIYTNQGDDVAVMISSEFAEHGKLEEIE